ncbi:MAG: heavy metal-binding domain-containing protein, partial [Planctomycetota bacterium]|nr:heavy metal-binding domain-containing protein [Planctomycetota bacterium]
MPSQRGRSLEPKRILALLSLACIAGFAGCGKGPGSSPASSEAPAGPLHFSCSEHPRVVSLEEGSCGVCKLELTPQKSVGTFLCVDHFESASVVPAGCTVCDKLLVAVPGGKIWKCTSHPEVVLDDPGACPVCDLELVEVLVGLVWVCPKSLEETLGQEGATGLTVLRLQGRSLGFSTEEVAFGKQDCSRCGRPLLGVT